MAVKQQTMKKLSNFSSCGYFFYYYLVLHTPLNRHYLSRKDPRVEQFPQPSNRFPHKDSRSLVRSNIYPTLRPHVHVMKESRQWHFDNVLFPTPTELGNKLDSAESFSRKDADFSGSASVAASCPASRINSLTV